MINDEFEPIASRAGSFGEFVTYGVLFQRRGSAAREPLTWLLTLVEPASLGHSDLVREYWVHGTEFRRVLQERLLDFDAKSTFVLDDATTEPPETEKRAALEAIAAWEKRLK